MTSSDSLAGQSPDTPALTYGGDRLPPAVSPDGVVVDHDCDFRRMLREIAVMLGVDALPSGNFDAHAVEDALRAALAAPGVDTAAPSGQVSLDDLFTPLPDEQAVAAVRDALRTASWPADIGALHDHLARVAVAALAARTPQPSEGWRFEHVFALREAATQCRWNIDHVEGVPEPSLEFQRHWRGTAVWLEKRAAAIERGEKPDAGYRPGEPT